MIFRSALLLWLVAGTTFALWLRRRDQARAVERFCRELPPLTVTITADLSRFRDALVQMQESWARAVPGIVAEFERVLAAFRRGYESDASGSLRQLRARCEAPEGPKGMTDKEN